MSAMFTEVAQLFHLLLLNVELPDTAALDDDFVDDDDALERSTFSAISEPHNITMD